VDAVKKACELAYTESRVKFAGEWYNHGAIYRNELFVDRKIIPIKDLKGFKWKFEVRNDDRFRIEEYDGDHFFKVKMSLENSQARMYWDDMAPATIAKLTDSNVIQKDAPGLGLFCLAAAVAVKRLTSFSNTGTQLKGK
jgi:hypothetical protein